MKNIFNYLKEKYTIKIDTITKKESFHFKTFDSLPINSNFYDFINHPFYNYLDDNVQLKNYCGSDNYELLKKNIIHQPLEWKYGLKKITYRLNKSGFRTYEFKDIDWRNCIVLLGCSNTFGIGVDEDETLSYFLEKLTNKQVVNLGMGGISNDVIIEKLNIIINKFEIPTNIIINWTSPDRFRYYLKNKFIDCGNWITEESERELQKNQLFGKELETVNLNTLYYNLNAIETNIYFKMRNLSNISKALSKNNFNLITFSCFPDAAYYSESDYFFPDDSKVNKARDLIHPGSDYNQIVAETIVGKLK